jgi:hypothetical protein
MAALIVGALGGATKTEQLAPPYCPAPRYWSEFPLTPEIDEFAAGSFKLKQPPTIQGAGYVVKSLEAALWAFYRGSSFSEGCLLAVNLGDDADTTAAIYGQLAGAFYGEAGIPRKWLDMLAKQPEITALADRLFESSRRMPI